jgi:sorbose reductase
MTDLVQPLKGGNFIHQEGPGSSCGSLLGRFSLKGKTAVVTGAGGGIGLSVAQAFAELGANVAIWYNSNESAHDRAGEISEKYGVKCKCRTFYPTMRTISANGETGKAFKVNIKDYSSVEHALDDQVREFNGRLDVFVANAGIP